MLTIPLDTALGSCDTFLSQYSQAAEPYHNTKRR